MIRKDIGNFEGNSDGTKIGQQSRILAYGIGEPLNGFQTDGWMNGRNDR